MSAATGVIPLSGRSGIIGFVPKDAIDRESHLIELAVAVTFEGTATRWVRFRTSIAELQTFLSQDRAPDAAASLRKHVLVKDALPLIFEAMPQLEQASIDRVAMYWVRRYSDQLEPFLR